MLQITGDFATMFLTHHGVVMPMSEAHLFAMVIAEHVMWIPVSMAMAMAVTHFFAMVTIVLAHHVVRVPVPIAMTHLVAMVSLAVTIIWIHVVIIAVVVAVDKAMVVPVHLVVVCTVRVGTIEVVFVIVA